MKRSTLDHVGVAYRARRLLARLDAADLAQRKIKWLALKASILIKEMNSTAAPKLKSIDDRDRKRWEVEIRLILQILDSIRERGLP